MPEPTDWRPAERTDRPRSGAPTLFAASVASERYYGLAEGPLWDEHRERVLWVDVNAGHVHSGSLDGSVITPADRLGFDETVGAVVCSAEGQLLVAGRRDLYRVTRDSRREMLANVIPAGKNSRLNDGACDPVGRFLVGSLALDARVRDECLWQIGPGGSVAIIDDDVTLSNGLAWSPDGAVLYSVDTALGIVCARPYDAASGNWGTRAVILRIGEGAPDGLCVDTYGNLWIAIWPAEGASFRVLRAPGHLRDGFGFGTPVRATVTGVGAAAVAHVPALWREENIGAALRADPCRRSVPFCAWTCRGPLSSGRVSSCSSR